MSNTAEFYRSGAFAHGVRRFAGWVSVAAVVSGLSAGPALSADLVISNWAGYMAPDIAETFKAATGLEIEVVNHATNEEIMGKLMAGQGKGYDVVFVSSPFAQVLNAQGLLEPLGAEKVPNLANLYPEATRLAFDPGNTFAVPYAWGTTGLCYRSDLVEGTPDSWSYLLKPPEALKGKVTCCRPTAG